MKHTSEKALYPVVERWLRRHYRCFETSVNAGLRIGRVDVIGVRDVGGDLSGEVEVIGVEVKRGTQPFGTAAGQTLGYKIYVNRVYLADYRQKQFSLEDIAIASHLGIGLIQIKGRKCIEVLSSPYYRPMARLSLALLERLSLGLCQVCRSVFRIGDSEKGRFANLARENLKKALDRNKGLMFWNRELADRKNRLGIRPTAEDVTVERRFICPDCVSYLLSQFGSGRDS